MLITTVNFFFFTSDANNKLQKEHTCLILRQKFPLHIIFHLTTIYPMCNCSNYQYLLSTIILTVLALLLHITSYGSCWKLSPFFQPNLPVNGLNILLQNVSSTFNRNKQIQQLGYQYEKKSLIGSNNICFFLINVIKI